ncbi:MAG: fluoride efflux transporter FluC [Cyanobium sp.]
MNRPTPLQELGLVAAGAVPGALLRWQLLRPDPPAAITGWGVDTLIANLLGALLLGLLLAQPPQRTRLLLWGGIGLCGSLTSFSTWMLQVCQAWQLGRWLQGLVMLLAPLPAGLALLRLGQRLGPWLGGRRGG